MSTSRWSVAATCCLMTAIATAQSPDEEDPALQDIAVEYYANKYRTDTEEARQRLRIQDQAAGIEDRLQELLADQFAGIWYDHADRGRLKIGMSRTAEARTADVLRAARDHGVEGYADLVSVRFTQAELERQQDSVRESLMDMILNGYARTSHNPRLNSVVVTALASLPASEERRIAQLSGTDGVTVQRVRESTLFGTLESCNVTYCDPPLRGGRSIVSSLNGCTGAFTARHRVNTSHLLLLTAGHCIMFGGPEWSAKNEANLWRRIGPSYGYVFAGGPGKDAGAVRIDPISYWALPSPLASVVVKSSALTTYNPNYKIKYDATSSLGQLLCQTGASTGTACAEVSDLGADHVVSTPAGNFLLKNLGELDMCGTTLGDSGAPIYKKNKAYGLHVGTASGTFTCHTMYQGIRGAENALNVDILLSP